MQVDYATTIKIEKPLKDRYEYIKYINEQIVYYIGKYIDNILKISDSDEIFEINGANIGFNINISKEDKPLNMSEDNLFFKPEEETLKIAINPINIVGQEIVYVSRMEELKMQNSKKATFKERLEILFKGTLSGGRVDMKEVKNERG